MMSVAAMAMVLMILLSANTETVGVTAQGVNCWDSCNTACVGLPRMHRFHLPFSLFLFLTILVSNSTLMHAIYIFFLTE